MRTRMYLDIHIMSAPSMPTQGPTWYSCFFSKEREGKRERERGVSFFFSFSSLSSLSQKKKKLEKRTHCAGITSALIPEMLIPAYRHAL